MEKGKEEEEIKLAVAYLTGQLAKKYPLFKIPSRQQPDFENEFPLFLLPKGRKKNRNNIWKQITALNSNTQLKCQSAIRCFSRLLIAQHSMKRFLPILIKNNKFCRKMKSRRIALLKQVLDTDTIGASLDIIGKSYVQGSQLIVPMIDSRKFINDWIENLESELQSSNPQQIDFLGELLKVDKVLQESIYDRNQFLKEIHIVTGDVSKYLSNLTPKYIGGNFFPIHGRPKIFVFNILRFILFIELAQKTATLDIARQLTAELLNEYCYHNTVLKTVGISEQTRATMKHLTEKKNGVTRFSSQLKKYIEKCRLPTLN